MGDQVCLENKGKLNGDIMIISNGNGLEVNNIEKISCNGNGFESEIYGIENKNKYSENELLEDLDSYWDEINDRVVISRMVNDSVIKGIVKAVEQEASEKIALKESEISSLKKFHKLEVTLKDDEPMKSHKYAVNDQFQKLKKEIDNARGFNSIKRIGSGSELLGLGGILPEKECEKWARVDKTLTSLKQTMVTMCESVDNLLNLKNEQEFKGEIEDMVINKLQKGFEEKISEDQNVKFNGIFNLNWDEKFIEISSLRKDLDAITKLLSTPETLHLSSHGSVDINNSHHKPGLPLNHALSTASFFHGMLEDSKIDMPESFDVAQLKHMSKDELVSHFNSIITKMRRDHESMMHKKTEEYFSLKREYLNVKKRGTDLPNRNNTKEFDLIRKKIPDVISSLDRILVQNENLPGLSNNDESVGNLKERINSLVSENIKLRDLLNDKNNELEDVIIEGSVNEVIHKCFLKELIEEHVIVNAETMNKCYVEDSNFEKEICCLIFEESVKDAKCKFNEMYSKYMNEHEKILSREKIALEKLTRLWVVIEEREKLKQEVEEKKKEKEELLISLDKEKEQLKVISEELTMVKEQVTEEQTLAFERSKEVELLKDQLGNALSKTREDKMEICKLRKIVEEKIEELKIADEQRDENLLCFEANEKKLKKQMEGVVENVNGVLKLFAEFESKVEASISTNGSRLKDSCLEMRSLIEKANSLRITGLMHKRIIARKCEDLQIAEEEVDLLGNEVDKLLCLLEKIHIALNHYSPILKHYPGITEIHQLVRRELSGESTKSC